MDNNLNEIMEYLQDKLDNSVDDFDRMYWEMRIRDIEEDIKECENQPTQCRLFSMFALNRQASILNQFRKLKPNLQ